MQQLTLQFEGFAQTGRTIEAEAPATAVQVINRIQQRVHRQGAMRRLQLSDVSLRLRGRVLSAIRTCRSSEALQDALECSALMAAGLFVIFMAAVLQGGAA